MHFHNVFASPSHWSVCALLAVVCASLHCLFFCLSVNKIFGRASSHTASNSSRVCPISFLSSCSIISLLSAPCHSRCLQQQTRCFVCCNVWGGLNCHECCHCHCAGLADPSPVAFTFFANPWIASHFQLDSIVCVQKMGRGRRVISCLASYADGLNAHALSACACCALAAALLMPST